MATIPSCAQRAQIFTKNAGLISCNLVCRIANCERLSTMPGKSTIKDCLTTLGVPASGLSSCAGFHAEWALIKKGYFKKVLSSHPDKGGDPAVFRDVQTSFEVLRKIFEEAKIVSFAASLDQAIGDVYKGAKEDYASSSTPSWEYYAEAAKETYATYRVELAKSNRSRCQKSGEIMEKGSIRIGFMLDSGGYGLWTSLEHWRVPSKIWLGLPDPSKHRDSKRFEKALLRMNEVSLCGMSDLAAAQRKKVAKYVMDKSHWTFGGAVDKVRKKPAAESSDSKSSSKSESTALVVAGKAKEQFVIPVPGNGAPKDSLAGQTFVITGTFPEVGGGTGFQVGKDRVKKMITSFGGKVSSSVSAKTDVVVVGKNPGFSKVQKARKQATTRLLGLQDMKVGLQRGSLGNAQKPLKIESFATGFGQRRGGPNGKAPPKARLTIAAGKKQVASTSKRAIADAGAAGGRAAATKKRPAAADDRASKLRRQ
eukprot:TRINITY_DN1358_c0_g2_i1.p1 TRINITY_DN1358_c0_g2~~TRINITY_DN1358_c0_g2_i1.p1  ORF type:complete len:480 (+),score=70.28 TRINITY_DN1358_c0_g2_i1:104-1543(+)